MESADEGKRLSPPSSLSTSSDLLHAAATEAPKSPTALRKRDEDNVIGILEPGLSQTFPGVEPGDGRSGGGDLRTSPATTLGEVDIAGNGLGGTSSSLPYLRTDNATTLGEANLSTTGRESLSHHSVSDGSEAFELGSNETTKLVDSQIAPDYTDDDFLAGLMPNNEQPSHDSATTQSPPTQVMERPGDPASSSSYRIPDYVFTRNKSTAPLEWSTASNESLFSIHMGNMSFTRDQFPWLGKSGELGLAGEVNMSTSLLGSIDFTSNQPPARQSAENSQKSGKLDEEPSPKVTEAKAAETMREVIMENAENHDKANAPVAADSKYHSACLSHASDGSTRSFAFPILAGGDGDSSYSLRGNAMKQKQHSPRTPKSQRESRQQAVKETPNASSSQTPNVAKCRWGLSCFSCCPSCC